MKRTIYILASIYLAIMVFGCTTLPTIKEMKSQAATLLIILFFPMFTLEFIAQEI